MTDHGPPECLNDEQWADIDEQIFRGYVPGVKRIYEICGVELNAAKDIFWNRYKCLRASRDANFARNHDEYCAGILE